MPRKPCFGRAPKGSVHVGARRRWAPAARKLRLHRMEKGEGKMIIGMQEGAKGDRVRDQRIAKVVELVPPERLLAEIPLGGAREKAVVEARQLVVEVLHGRDPRLMVVVGPCSVHDPKAALDYAGRLAELDRELNDRLLIVMRVYFEKPRTTTG